VTLHRWLVQAGGRWLLAAWLLLILSGALTSSLLRAPLVLSGVMPILLVSHMIGGAAIAIIAIGYVAAGPTPARWWRVTLVIGTGILGWLAHRSFAPLPTASHAALAAFATIALARVSFESPANDNPSPPAWIPVVARIGFVLVFVQVAAGAALRHHLIALTWHLVIGGLAAMAVLSAAVVTVQHQTATMAEKQSGRFAIGAIVAQASLGAAVLFMMLIGPPNAGTWIAITVAHVVVGTVTLLAVGRFNSVLDRQRRAKQLTDPVPRA